VDVRGPLSTVLKALSREAIVVLQYYFSETNVYT
jgi:hypothetical protein